MKRLLLLLLLGCVALSALAGEGAPPRIGLVLSGGGARGAAHVGVLKVLEELRIPIGAVAGTSMGALVGGVYASGMGASEMERRLQAVDWTDLLVDDPPRESWPIRRKQRDIQTPLDISLGVRQGKFRLPGGVLAGQKLEMLFNDLVAGAAVLPRFDDLPIPFRAVATDLGNGQMRVFDQGPLPQAMRASMSVPGVFAPVKIGGRLYVDGGLTRNLPVDVARRMGVDLVIAVNLGTSYLPEDQLESVLGVMAQMLVILTEQNVDDSLKQLVPGRDILVEPDLGDIAAGDFQRVGEAIRAGERAAWAAAERLRHLSLSPADYAAWRAARRPPAGDRLPVGAFAIQGLERVNAGLFAPLAEHQQGQPLDRQRLKADLASIYGRGDFTNLDYDLDPLDPGDPAGGANRLVIAAREKPWGPGYVNLGLGVSSDFRGDGRFGVRASYRRTWINALGAEWLTSLQFGNVMGLATEFFQPLTLDRRAFVAAGLGIGSVPIGVFAQGERIARYDLLRTGATLDLGATLFGGNAELRAGIQFGGAAAVRDTGVPAVIPENDLDETGPRASLRYDTLDSPYLPRHGQRLVLELRAPTPAMGADFDYQRLSMQWTGALTRGEHTLVGRIQGGQAWGEPMPYYDQFALGGFARLSGYADEELRGSEIAFGGLAYCRRLPDLTPSWARGVYVGASVEAAWIGDTIPELTLPGRRFGSSLFLAIDTLIGGAYLGQGFTGDGDNATYLIIGFP